MATTIFTNVRVFDGDRLTEPQTVIITEGIITGIAEYTPDTQAPEVPAAVAPTADALEPGTQEPGAQVIDGAGRALLPGLIDAHIHVAGRTDLDALAVNGVTTGFDMASWPVSLTAGLRAETGTTSILSAGVPFIGPAGPHSHFGMPPEAVVTDPSLVPDAVARRIKDGSDYIKVVTEAPGRGGPEPEVVAAVVHAAHVAHRTVVAHASHLDAFTMAFDAGADVLTHVPTQNPVPVALAERLAARGCVAIPTLTVSEILTTAAPRPGASYDAARDSVAALRQAGVPVFAGTDAVNQPGLPFSVPLGATLHRELELLVDAGYTPVEALRAATSLPAAYFGLNDRGVIREGLRADLVLVDGDPTTDIRVTRNIEGVWIAGERIS